VVAAPAGPRYLRRVPRPTTLQALSNGARASAQSAWLVAPGLLVAFLRLAVTWPAPVLALGLALAGIEARLEAGVLSPAGLLSGALAALTAPRAISILAGLWLAGLIASGALRAAWFAGALPVLGEELSAAPHEQRFAAGVAYGFAPLALTAVLGFALELSAQFLSGALALGTGLAVARSAGATHPVLSAAVLAGALTTAVAAPIVASLAADAALARTALSGDGPARALREGARRVLLRPGPFLLAALALGLVSAVVLGSVEAANAAVLGVARGAPILIALGPRLMANVLAAAIGVLVELWRMGTVAVLACSEPG
jgi:hypothetical protein